MPREGYINLTLRQSVRDRLARIARKQNLTMTEALEWMLQRTESQLGLKTSGSKPAARPSAARRPGKGKRR